MMVNRVNVKGLCKEEDLEKIILEGSEIFSKDFSLSLGEKARCKDIIEAFLATEILTFKLLTFKDGVAASITLLTEINLLLEEEEESTLISLKEEVIANHVMPIKNSRLSEDLQVKVLDCVFKLIKGTQIKGFLTYYIKEKNREPYFGEDIVEPRERYRNIDVFQEFP